MPVATESHNHEFEPIDPNAEPPVEDVDIRVPDLGRIDPQGVVFSYDRLSDILLVFLRDRDRFAVAAGGSGYYYALIDPDTDELVGLQIDDFLARAVKDQPSLIDVLDVAELRGLTVEELHQERQRVLGYRGRFRSWLGRELRGLRHRRVGKKQDIVRDLLRGDQLRLFTGQSLGAA